MEAAICTLVAEFKKYAGKDDSASTLSKEEFHKLVSMQLPNFVKVGPRPSLVLPNLAALLFLNPSREDE